MTAETAKAMADVFLEEIAFENKTTQKVLAAVPEGRADYRPDEKSRTALELARHIPVSDLWFLEAVAAGEFAQLDFAAAEEAVGSPAQAAALYDGKIQQALDKVKALPAEAFLKTVDMMGILKLPAVHFLSFCVRHQIHHRGQLSTYLRAMGAKVPSIYGGSADEPFEAVAAQA